MLAATTSARTRSAVSAVPLKSITPNKFISDLPLREVLCLRAEKRAIPEVAVHAAAPQD
jgi:hypothetical protein